MLDALMVLLTGGFLAMNVALIYGCDVLMKRTR